jgi:hypothetical protein
VCEQSSLADNSSPPAVGDRSDIEASSSVSNGDTLATGTGQMSKAFIRLKSQSVTICRRWQWGQVEYRSFRSGEPGSEWRWGQVKEWRWGQVKYRSFHPGEDRHRQTCDLSPESGLCDLSPESGLSPEAGFGCSGLPFGTRFRGRRWGRDVSKAARFAS